MKNLRVSIVIPCLNEEESIERVIAACKEGIEKCGGDGEVIIVDNGSTDRSVELATAARVRVLHESIRGYGAAIRKGFDEATGDVLVMGDADMTYDFSKVDDLVQPIADDEADFCIGNRMNNIQPGSMPKLHQYVGNPLLSMMLRVMFRSNTVRDAHCGMRAIRTSTYRSLGCVTTGMEFASEMVIRSIRNKVRTTERDIIYHAREGESKLRSFRDGWRHLRFMALHSPTSMLLIPGALLWLLGTILLVRLAFGPIMVNERAFDTHSLIAGGFLNIVSTQMVLSWLLAKAYAHLSGLRKDPLLAWLYQHLSIEKAMLYCLPFALGGLGLCGYVFCGWARSGFGELDQLRLLFLGMILLINTVQMGSSAYIFSIMALPRQLPASS